MLLQFLFISMILPPISSPYPDSIFSMEEIMFPNHGSIILTPEEVEAQSRLKEGEGYIDGEKVSLDLERIEGKDMDGKPLWFQQGKPADDLTKLINKARAAGYEFQINYAYRTYAQQARLYRRNPKLAGRPGRGGERTHQTGCSIDIEGTRRFIAYENVSPKHFNKKHCVESKSRGGWYCKTKFYWWLKKHAKLFRNDVRSEPWHWTYIGPLNDEAVGGD